MTATYPPVGDLERDDALARIRRRHEHADDSRWSEADADSDDAARTVLGYLRRHRGRFPRQVVQDDVWDELVLAAWVYWDERRREHELLTHALARGLSLREVGAFVGLHSAQGLRDHLDSIEARIVEHRHLTRRPSGRADGLDGALAAPPGVPRDPSPGLSPDPARRGTGDIDAEDELTTARGNGEDDVVRRSRNPYLRHRGRSRASRGADGKFVRAQRAAARQRPTRERWVDAHRARITSVLEHLVAQGERVLLRATQDDASDSRPPPVCDPAVDALLDPSEYLDWIREDLEDDDICETTLVSAGLALNGLRLRPEVAALPRHHALHGALRDADRLRSDYAALRPGS